MSNDEFDQMIAELRGRSPSPDFVAELRRTLGDELTRTDGARSPADEEGEVTVIDIDDRPIETSRRPSRGRVLAAVAAAVALGFIVLLAAGRGPDTTATDQDPATEGDTSTTAPPTTGQVDRPDLVAIGEAWTRAIVEGDRQAFVALHGPDLLVDDTVIGWSAINGTLTDQAITELYFAGFDALQASLAIDGDTIRSDGCVYFPASGNVQCEYSASIIGEGRTRTMRANMGIDDGLITRIDFTVLDTDPPRIMALVPQFINGSEVAMDRTCLEIGFNSVACGEHESDVFQRFLPEFETRLDP